jgi:hypothetical protein
MRIEAPCRTAHPAARPQHAAVHIDRQPAQTQPLDLHEDQIADQVAQRLQGLLGEGLQPGDHGAIRREPVESAEAQDDRIDAEKRQVRDPSAPHNDQPHHGQEHPDEPVVPLSPQPPDRGRHALSELEHLEEAPDQLQSAVCGDALLGERDRNVGMGSSANPALRYSHNSGPPVS